MPIAFFVLYPQRDVFVLVMNRGRREKFPLFVRHLKMIVTGRAVIVNTTRGVTVMSKPILDEKIQFGERARKWCWECDCMKPTGYCSVCRRHVCDECFEESHLEQCDE